MSPVRVDSRMPKGETSFMNESMRVGFAELGGVSNITSPAVFWGEGGTYSSTIQLLVLISNTLPPNWWAK